MRYSGCSLAYQFAAILGGMAPLICTALVAATGSVYAMAGFVIALAAVSFACSYLMTQGYTGGTRNLTLGTAVTGSHQRVSGLGQTGNPLAAIIDCGQGRIENELRGNARAVGLDNRCLGPRFLGTSAMTIKKLLIAAPVLLVLSHGSANAGNNLEEAGALVCITDKWDEKELEKGHKLVDAALRCGVVPDDPALPRYAQDCAAKYEYMPDGSWKAIGSCTNSYKGGDKSYETYEEGSHLKEYTYKKTGGTGKFEGISGGGTYIYDGLTDTIFGGRYQGTLVLP